MSIDERVDSFNLGKDALEVMIQYRLTNYDPKYNKEFENLLIQAKEKLSSDAYKTYKIRFSEIKTEKSRI